MKLGSPYPTGNPSRGNSRGPKRSGGRGQSYVWKVTVYKKRLLLSDIVYKTEIFTNKIAAAECENRWNNQEGYYAKVRKYDPTKR